MRRRAGALASLALVGLLASGCSTDHGRSTLDVYAAASLADVFETMADDFEQTHPDVDVRLTYAGSSTLATQITEGAPADVFASANEAQMEAVADHVGGTPVPFAINTLTIAVPAGNPADIGGLEDVAGPGVRTVVCAPQVPCGAATASLIEARGIALAPASEEMSVSDVLAKVDAGEADAGIVYVTDVARAQHVEAIEIDGADAFATRYMIAALADSDAAQAAQDFVAFVAGPDGRAALSAAGFGAP